MWDYIINNNKTKVWKGKQAVEELGQAQVEDEVVGEVRSWSWWWSWNSTTSPVCGCWVGGWMGGRIKQK